MTNDRDAGSDSQDLDLLQEALARLQAGFIELPPAEVDPVDPSAVRKVLLEVAERMHDNYPYFHPLYAGQMIKPPHPVARLAYALAQRINPNNHALDGGRASSRMEKEAVAEIARMFGWDTHLGHLCGGGTLANLEALWVAGQLHPGTTVLASTQAHYTHQRISGVLGLGFESVACDRQGRLDPEALEERLEQGGVGTVVATLGTTAVGAVDPLAPVIKLRERYGFRLHVDAAYGGYFRLAEGLAEDTRRSYDRLPEADSVVVDPHKHGLQPYGCGCILFRDPSVGRYYRHDSPYTYFTSEELHLGEISLECSRPGAAAVALWATQRLLPLVRGGEFAGMLDRTRSSALALYDRIRSDARFVTAMPPELDILLWAPRAGSVSEASDLSRRIFVEAGRRHLHLALAEAPVDFFDLAGAGINGDRATLTCLRSVLMKPEHLEWVDRIAALLGESADAAIGSRRNHTG